MKKDSFVISSIQNYSPRINNRRLVTNKLQDNERYEYPKGNHISWSILEDYLVKWDTWTSGGTGIQSKSYQSGLEFYIGPR
jgi:hypothetical protein